MWWDVVLRRNTGTAHEFNRRNKWVQNDNFTLTRLCLFACVCFFLLSGVWRRQEGRSFGPSIGRISIRRWEPIKKKKIKLTDRWGGCGIQSSSIMVGNEHLQACARSASIVVRLSRRRLTRPSSKEPWLGDRLAEPSFPYPKIGNSEVHNNGTWASHGQRCIAFLRPLSRLVSEWMDQAHNGRDGLRSSPVWELILLQ